jgi:hypothetical protein
VAFVPRKLGEIRKTSGRVAGDPAEIRTEYVPSSSLEQCFSNFFCSWPSFELDLSL